MLSGYMCKKNPNWVKTSKYLKIFLDTIPIFQLLSNSSFFEVLNDGQSVWVIFLYVHVLNDGQSVLSDLHFLQLYQQNNFSHMFII